jgi:hypothetical protein
MKDYSLKNPGEWGVVGGVVDREGKKALGKMIPQLGSTPTLSLISQEPAGPMSLSFYSLRILQSGLAICGLGVGAEENEEGELSSSEGVNKQEGLWRVCRGSPRTRLGCGPGRWGKVLPSQEAGGWLVARPIEGSTICCFCLL